MGNRYCVWGWTFGLDPSGPQGWHYAGIYSGESLIAALWHAFRSRRHYGCVKLEMR